MYNFRQIMTLVEGYSKLFEQGLPISDEDMQNAPLENKIKAKMFKNRELPEGTKVAVRLNLNGKVGSYFIQTVHDARVGGTPLGYDKAVTVTNATFFVSQAAREKIAKRVQNKYPMAAVIGGIKQGDSELTGVEVRFNPMSGHLFTRVDNGWPVKGAEEVTVFNTRCYVRGKIEYWDEKGAPKARGEVPTDVKYASRDEYYPGEPEAPAPAPVKKPVAKKPAAKLPAAGQQGDML